MLPQSLFEDLGNASASVFFTLYETAVFFTLYETAVFFPLAEGSQEDATVGTSVIAAAVAGMYITNLQENITILLQLENPVG